MVRVGLKSKVLSVVLLAGFSLGLTPYVATAATSAELEELRGVEVEADDSIAVLQSRLAQNHVLVSGMVTEDSRPVERASIVARIWPNTAVLQGLKVGEKAPVLIVDYATTGPDGRFAIALLPELVDESYRELDGSVSVQIWLVHDGREVPWNFSALPPSVKDGSGNWSTEALRQSESKLNEALQVDFEIGTRANVTQSDDPATSWVGSDSAFSSERSPFATIDGGVPVALATSTCWAAVPVGGTWLYNNRERFMAVYGWTGAMAKISQAVSSSSTHTVGIGYKPNVGSWSVNGSVTQTISTSSSQTVTGITNAFIHNSINYRRWNCSEANDNTAIIGTEIRPAGFYDIFNEPHTSALHVSYTLGCVPKSAGTSIIKTQGTNQTFSAGVTTPLMNLSARSGFNQGTRLEFNVTAPSKVCGNSSQGWLAASSIDVRSQ
jgi:hypothetical protein